MKKGEERRDEERGRRHTPILVLGLYRMLSKFEELKRKVTSDRWVSGSVVQWFRVKGERCQVSGVRFIQCVWGSNISAHSEFDFQFGQCPAKGRTR